jgi:Major Facilitator Superfamily
LLFFVNLPLGVVALTGLGLTLPKGEIRPSSHRLDAIGAAILAAATTGLMLVLGWGGDRYAWDSVEIIGLAAATLGLAGGLVVCERRAGDPIVPLAMLRQSAVALPSAAMFMATATMFAITVFVPLFLQTATGADPTEAGLLLVPMMVGIVVSTTIAGRRIAATGLYKRYPVAGLGLMTAALVALAVAVRDPSQAATGAGLLVFGLGFGMVTQVLMIAVQSSVDRREIATATAVTSFFRGLGGAVGAAVLGAVFAANAGAAVSEVGGSTVDASAGADVVNGVQAVFIAAAPLALIGLAAVLRLKETRLQGRRPAQQQRATPTAQATGEVVAAD